MSTTELKADILNNVDPLASLAGLVRTGGRLDICKALPGCTPAGHPHVRQDDRGRQFGHRFSSDRKRVNKYALTPVER